MNYMLIEHLNPVQIRGRGTIAGHGILKAVSDEAAVKKFMKMVGSDDPTRFSSNWEKENCEFSVVRLCPP